MAKSIVISLGGGLRHLGHFGHFDFLPHFDFFDCSGGVGDQGDSSTNGGPNGESNNNGCKQCRSEGGVIDCGLTPQPSILSSNSMNDQWCFGAMMGFEMQKKS